MLICLICFSRLLVDPYDITSYGLIMKVTALIPDELVSEIKEKAGGKTLTDSLVVALSEWVSLKKIKELNEQIERSPLKFNEGYTSDHIREINRQ